MKQDRRTFLQFLLGFWMSVFFKRTSSSGPTFFEEQSDNLLLNKIHGLWKLQSYTYTSNKKTYTSPKKIEATANFKETEYDVNFSTHISRAGVKRTRRASESGTYSLSGNRIRLFAEEASSKEEKGEEFLTDVQIEGDIMNLISNNGANQEVWKKSI